MNLTAKWNGLPVWLWGIAGVGGVVVGFLMMRGLREPAQEEGPGDGSVPIQLTPVRGVWPGDGSETHTISGDVEIVALKDAIAQCKKDSDGLRFTIQQLKNAIATQNQRNRERDDKIRNPQPEPPEPPPPPRDNRKDFPAVIPINPGTIVISGPSDGRQTIHRGTIPRPPTPIEKGGGGYIQPISGSGLDGK